MMCLVHSASPSHGLAWQERSTEITSDLLIPISKHIQVRRVPRECSLHYSISMLNIFSSISISLPARSWGWLEFGVLHVTSMQLLGSRWC